MQGKDDQESASYEILYLQKSYEGGWLQVGRWTSEGITLQSNQLLRGKEKANSEIPRLRAAVVEYPPLTMKADFDSSEGCYQGLECKKYIGNTDNFTTYCCYGLAIDVLRYVKTELQFEPQVYFVRDGNYGAKNSIANTWNGIVRDIQEGKADIAIDLMTNEARSEVIDFSLRWTHAGLALLVLVGEQKVERLDFSFFHPFTSYLWMSMIGVVNFYLGILWYTDRLSPYGHYKSVRAKNHNGFDLSESMWYCWGVCFDNQFVDSRPRSLSARAMAVVLAIFALMCVTSYTANLTAHLLSDDTKPDVTGIRDPKVGNEFPVYEKNKNKKNQPVSAAFCLILPQALILKMKFLRLMTHSYYKEGCLSSVYIWKNAVVSFHPRIIRTERFKWDKVFSAFFKIVKPSHVVQNRLRFHRSLLKRPFARKLPILRGRENKSAAFPLRTTMKLLRLCPSVSRMKAYKKAALQVAFHFRLKH